MVGEIGTAAASNRTSLAQSYSCPLLARWASVLDAYSLDSLEYARDVAALHEAVSLKRVAPAARQQAEMVRKLRATTILLAESVQAAGAISPRRTTCCRLTWSSSSCRRRATELLQTSWQARHSRT